jgi:arginine utilization protein RocB
MTNTSTSNGRAKHQLDQQGLNSDNAAGEFSMNRDSSDMNSRTASNIQMIHHMTKRLSEIDDFDEVPTSCNASVLFN